MAVSGLGVLGVVSVVVSFRSLKEAEFMVGSVVGGEVLLSG